MKNITKVFATIITVASAVAQIPGVSEAVKVLVAAHPHSAIFAVGSLLFATLVHNPKK